MLANLSCRTVQHGGWDGAVTSRLRIVILTGAIWAALCLAVTSGYAAPQQQVAPAPARPSRVIGGLSVTLKQATVVEHAESALPPPRGKEWLRTVWRFHNVSRREAKVQLPVASAGPKETKAQYLGHTFPHYQLQPGMSVNIVWYFAIPRKAKGVWLQYGSGSTVLWFQVKLR